MWQICLPIDKLLLFVHWPQTPTDIQLMASQTMAWLYLFFSSAGHYPSSGLYSPVIPARRQWLPDTRAPCKRSLCSTCTQRYILCTLANTVFTNKHLHTSNMHTSLSHIQTFCFSDSKKKGEVFGIVYTPKVIAFSCIFCDYFLPNSPLFPSIGRFQSLCHRCFSKLLAAKSMSIRWVIARC